MTSNYYLEVGVKFPVCLVWWGSGSGKHPSNGRKLNGGGGKHSLNIIEAVPYFMETIMFLEIFFYNRCHV